MHNFRTLLSFIWERVFPVNILKYQLFHTRFDQISDHKHDIYLYQKLSTKLLAQGMYVDTF